MFLVLLCSLLLLAAELFHVLSCLFLLLCLDLKSQWGRGGWLLSFSLVCNVCVVCLGLLAFPLGVIGWLCSVIVVASLVGCVL